jgi:hypothetical protein
MTGPGGIVGAGAGPVVARSGETADASDGRAISVQIGTLVVDGLNGSPSRGVHVGEALGPALERLFEQRGVPARWQAGLEVERLALAITDLPPDAADWRVIDALARALYRALDRGW